MSIDVEEPRIERWRWEGIERGAVLLEAKSGHFSCSMELCFGHHNLVS
jgi:hypothetical protein